MAITRVHHVGLVNGDLDHARQVLVEGFGLAVDEHRSPLPGRTGYDGTTILDFPIGVMFYVVAIPYDSTCDAAKFLESSK